MLCKILFDLSLFFCDSCLIKVMFFDLIIVRSSNLADLFRFTVLSHDLVGFVILLPLPVLTPRGQSSSTLVEVDVRLFLNSRHTNEEDLRALCYFRTKKILFKQKTTNYNSEVSVNRSSRT